MANSASHGSLPYPIKNARFSILVPFLDADGDPTAQTTPDTEFSGDNGAAADTAEEVSATSGMDGIGLLTFTGAETNYSTLAANFKAASGPKATLAALYPRALVSIGTGTLSAGSAGGGTLGTVLLYDLSGCFIKTTGGTGGGGTGGANNQARKIMTYDVSTGAFTVEPNWETTPSTDTTYAVLLPEGVTLGMLKTLNPTTPGRTLAVGTDNAAQADILKVSTSATAADNLETAALAYSATRGLAGTALPAAAADAAGGLPISDAGGLDLDAVGAAVTSGTHGNAALKTLIDAVDNFVDTEIGAIQTTLGTPASTSISADILVLDNLVDDLESRIGTPSNFGSGATLSANLVDIEGQTDDIGAAGAGLTAIGPVTLATSQPNYAPAKAGDEMDFIDAPNSTALAAIASAVNTGNGFTGVI